MTEQDLIHKIEWVNKRCSLKDEPLTQSQIELLKFVFADIVVNKNLDLADVSGQLPAFLYEDEGQIKIGYRGDTVVTDEWNKWRLGNLRTTNG